MLVSLHLLTIRLVPMLAQRNRLQLALDSQALLSRHLTLISQSQSCEEELHLCVDLLLGLASH